MNKLNLGCGHDVRNGWINLDSSELPNVDVVHNIEKLPLPFENDSFDQILAKDILEHVEYTDVLRDLHRILRKGGTLTIQVPHFTSVDNYIDPTHKKRFSVQTFEFFLHDAPHCRNYYFDFSFERIQSISIDFQKGIFFYNYLVEAMVNVSDRSRRIYERTGISRIFPAQNILITLVK